MKFKIVEHIDERHNYFFINDVQVGFCDYETHGSAAMDATYKMFRNISKILNAELVYEEVYNCD